MPPQAGASRRANSAQRDGARVGGDRRALARFGAGPLAAFLFLHLHEPHQPYAPPERFSEYSPYDAEIAYADEIVGRLIQYLKAHQLYDRSTIVLLSDHGEGLGDHGEQEHGLFVYDETIHVPLIVKQDGNEGAGRRVADVVQHVDLVPTILDLVKAPVPANLRGRSLKPLLEGAAHRSPTGPSTRRRCTRSVHFGWSELTAIIDGRYRVHQCAAARNCTTSCAIRGSTRTCLDPDAQPPPHGRRRKGGGRVARRAHSAGADGAQGGDDGSDAARAVGAIQRTSATFVESYRRRARAHPRAGNGPQRDRPAPAKP